MKNEGENEEEHKWRDWRQVLTETDVLCLQVLLWKPGMDRWWNNGLFGMRFTLIGLGPTERLHT